MKTPILLLLGMIVYGSVGFAAAHGDGHALEVPRVVFYQLINFSILFFGLYFLLRKKVATYFLLRSEQFAEAFSKAQRIKMEAQQRKLEIEERLSKLIASSDDSLKKAYADAEMMKKQMISEAEDIAKGLRREGEKSAFFEIEKARTLVKKKLINDAKDYAQKLMRTKLLAADQQRLNAEFVEKIQVHS